MKFPNFKISILGILLLLIGVVSCKDDFTEEDLVKQQNDLKKTVSASDSLQFLAAMNELEYKKYVDSLKRADSLALQAGLKVYLPYTYEVQVKDGSISTQNGGRTEAFAADVVVTITQYGVKQTATARDGLYTFKNIGVGVIHGTVISNGYTTFEWTVDVTLPYAFFKETTSTIAAGTGGTGASGGVGGAGAQGSWYVNNPYALKELLKYYNQRSFGNVFTIFATTGASTNTVTGRAFIETNLTNRTKEVVPAGTTIAASIDLSNAGSSATFISRYVTTATSAVVANPTQTAAEPLTLVNGVFSPRKYAYTFLGTAATDASGDFTLTVPATPDGLMPINFEYSDVVANKTFFIESNGDVTAIVRRNVYGQGVTASGLPVITLAPTVTFEAGKDAAASARFGGNGSVSDIDLVNGGQNYIGTPRVWFTLPSTGGIQATATATVTNGVVSAIAIGNAGSGYTSAPTITITEGAGAEGTASTVVTSTNGGVANVVVGNAGTMNFVPNVVFYRDAANFGVMDANESLDATNFPNGVPSGVGTNFPAATAVLNTSGVGIGSINVTTAGSGLAANPSVAITSGDFAAGTVTITGGVVTAVTISNAGKYYVSGLTLSIPSAGTPTTAAVLTPTLTNGTVSAIAITTAGAGYPVANGAYTIVFTPRSVGTASATAVWQGLTVGGINITNGGTQQLDGKYYTSVPKVNITEPQFKGTGSKVAVGTAVLGQDGRVIGVNITDAGFGYTSAPTITFVSGTNATATAKFADKSVLEIEVTNGGSNYIVAPQVLIVDQTKAGSGATATAKLTGGKVTSIQVTNGGTGYINGATVHILNPGFSFDAGTNALIANPAKANVIVQAGVITSMEVYAAGDNYPAGTEVRITASKGTGATATATIANGKVSAVAVTAGGTQYVGNNYAKALGNGGAAYDGTQPNVAPSSSASKLEFNSQLGAPYMAKSGVRKVLDIHYGTGTDRD